MPGRRRWFYRPVSIAGYLLVLVCATAVAVPLVGQVTGRWRLLPVLSGSMAPGMVRGDLAWLEPKPTSELRAGDVLVYNSPRWGSSRPRRIIHRVVQVVEPSRIRPSDVRPGAVYIRTKGDASADPDPWIAAVVDKTVWVRTRTLPSLGRPLLVMVNSSFRVLALLAAGALMAGVGASTLVRQEPEKSSAGGSGSPISPLPEPAFLSQQAPSPSSQPPFSTAATAGAVGILTVAVAGITAAVAASLTGAEQSRGTVGAGAVVLEIGTSTLPVTVSDLLPGEKVERVVELRNSGSISLAWLFLEITADPSPMLDPTGGLQLSVDRCPEPWQVGTGQDGQPQAQCPSSEQSLVAERPLVGRTELDLLELDADAPGGVDHLRITMRLTEAAGPSTSESVTATIEFLGGQRQGSVR
ncbi:MAG TPA: signal peptidase I [Actinomycetota bacterium]|nr:signal peptidase I [Actinomycetota bacterium]